jgi:hypothetical protein
MEPNMKPITRERMNGQGLLSEEVSEVVAVAVVSGANASGVDVPNEYNKIDMVQFCGIVVLFFSQSSWSLLMESV